jgi:hypothetical protein
MHSCGHIKLYNMHSTHSLIYLSACSPELGSLGGGLVLGELSIADKVGIQWQSQVENEYYSIPYYGGIMLGL